MIFKLAALGAIGYFGYKAYSKNRTDDNGVAFSKGEPKGAFRNAGSEATTTKDKMSKHDEALDETFPASDATAKY